MRDWCSLIFSSSKVFTCWFIFGRGEAQSSNLRQNRLPAARDSSHSQSNIRPVRQQLDGNAQSDTFRHLRTRQTLSWLNTHYKALSIRKAALVESTKSIHSSNVNRNLHTQTLDTNFGRVIVLSVLSLFRKHIRIGRPSMVNFRLSLSMLG